MKNAKSLLLMGVLQFILFVFPWTKLKKFFFRKMNRQKSDVKRLTYIEEN